MKLVRTEHGEWVSYSVKAAVTNRETGGLQIFISPSCGDGKSKTKVPGDSVLGEEPPGLQWPSPDPHVRQRGSCGAFLFLPSYQSPQGIV